jgi:hypothetical protein
MPARFRFELYVGCALHTRARFEPLWALFSDALVGASRWGREEATTEAFTTDPGPAFALLKGSGWLFIDGAKDGFASMIRRQRGELYSIDIWLSASAMDGKRGEAWVRWMLRLVEACPVLFGHGETTAEHDAKHLLDTGDSESWLGSSLADLHAFLPGIYWLTVFGRDLARTLPIDELTAHGDVVVHRTTGGTVVLVLAEPAKPTDLGARLAVERKLAALLGDELFFDRERPDRVLRAVPAFVSELERCKKAVP